MNYNLTYYWYFICIPAIVLEVVWGLYILFTSRNAMSTQLTNVMSRTGGVRKNSMYHKNSLGGI